MIAAALRCEGTPFAHQHHHPGRGMDCLGLPRAVGMEVIGFDATARNPLVRPFADYGRQPEPAKLFAALHLFCDPVAWVADARGLIAGGQGRAVATGADAVADARPGDVLVMRTEAESPPSHVGILLERDYVIHALQTEGKVVRHRMDARWKAKVVAAFAFKGLAD